MDVPVIASEAGQAPRPAGIALLLQFPVRIVEAELPEAPAFGLQSKFPLQKLLPYRSRLFQSLLSGIVADVEIAG